jgi:hypothetical protein
MLTNEVGRPAATVGNWYVRGPDSAVPFRSVEKLMVPVGTHPCTLLFGDRQVHAELEFSTGNPPRGWAYDVPGAWKAHEDQPNSGVSSFSPRVEPAGTIFGRMRMGFDLVLLGARINHLLPDRARVFADMAMCGWDLRSEADLEVWPSCQAWSC